jgi:hypothetical protein
MTNHSPCQPDVSFRIPTGPLAGYPRRPRINRKTELDLDHVRGVVNGAAFAERNLAKLLNTHLTVTWQHSALFNGLDQDWTTLQTQLLGRLTRWLFARRVVTAFVWVRERSRGMGRHTHVLAHLGPRPEILSRDLKTDLTEKFSFGPRGIKITYGRFGANTPRMQAGLLRYILKGIDPEAFRYSGLGAETEKIADFLGIQHRGRQGTIKIKRCGVSQNIGPKARCEAGWPEQRDLASLRRILQPDEQPPDERPRPILFEKLERRRLQLPQWAQKKPGL